MQGCGAKVYQGRRHAGGESTEGGSRRRSDDDRKALCTPPQRRKPFATYRNVYDRLARNQTFQISLAYWLMVRSEENLPAEATFIRHLRAKDRLSLKSRLACSLAAR